MKRLLLLQCAGLSLFAQSISSVFPLTVQRGQSHTVTMRGTGLETARGLFFGDGTVTGKVVKVETEGPAGKDAKQIVQAAIAVGETAAAGEHRFRVMTAEGLSSEGVLRVAEAPVLTEPGGTIGIPAVVAGRLAASGEADLYWIEVRAGQTLRLQAVSGSATLDPAIGICEPSGSWFDPQRLNRIAFNDEPLYFPGITRDAFLRHRFVKGGRYCVRLDGFNGQGGADAVYELRIREDAPGDEPSLRPAPRAEWEEHLLTRAISEDWLQRVAGRGGGEAGGPYEVYHAVPQGAGEIPVMKMPGLVTGVIGKPGESHVIRVQVDKAQETVIEVETPEATTPVFTPVVTLVEPGGAELVGNLYTRLNNNNLKMMKSVTGKTTFSLHAPGVYTLQIHELATDHAGADYRYRVLVRQQVPHVGKFAVQQERVNLARGGTRPLTVRIEREEGFTGMVAFEVENLPPGVRAMAGMEDPNERPILPNAGKVERYQPKVQSSSLLLSAAGDAPLSEAPVVVRVVARPVREGQVGEPIGSIAVPLVVVEKQVSK